MPTLPIHPVIVIVSVNNNETHSLLDTFVGKGKATAYELKGGLTYNDLGIHGGHRIIHTICEMGASGIGASQQRTRDAIEHWQPRAVIAVGIAFGLDETKQKIGDVLVSAQIQDYELGRLNNDGTITPRGDKPSSTNILLNRFRQVNTSKSRCDTDWPNVQFGLILTGQKLVDNLSYRESLKALFPEAIGGEMEGVGLYVSASAAKVDWIVIKAICDWGHNKNQADKDAWQKLAANNAARVLKAALDVGGLYNETLLPESTHSPSGFSSLRKDIGKNCHIDSKVVESLGHTAAHETSSPQKNVHTTGSGTLGTIELLYRCGDSVLPIYNEFEVQLCETDGLNSLISRLALGLKVNVVVVILDDKDYASLCIKDTSWRKEDLLEAVSQKTELRRASLEARVNKCIKLIIENFGGNVGAQNIRACLEKLGGKPYNNSLEYSGIDVVQHGANIYFRADVPKTLVQQIAEQNNFHRPLTVLHGLDLYDLGMETIISSIIPSFVFNQEMRPDELNEFICGNWVWGEA